MKNKNRKMNMSKAQFQQKQLESAILSRVEKRIEKEIEIKYFDVNQSGFLLNTGPFVKLSAIPAGFAQTQRTANVKIADLKLNFLFLYNFTAVGFAQDLVDNLRIVIFRWRADDGADLPQVADILQNPSFPVTSNFTYETKDKYPILSDIRTKVSGFYDPVTSFAVPTVDSSQHIARDIKINKTIKFNLGVAVTTGFGHIYILFLSDSVVLPHPEYVFTSRIMYTDNMQ